MTPDEICGRLQEHRDEILRAELVGWLHAAWRMRPRSKRVRIALFLDPAVVIGRMTSGGKAEAELKRDSTARPFSAQVERKFAETNIVFPGESCSFGELLTLWNTPFIEVTKRSDYGMPLDYGPGLKEPIAVLPLFHASHTRASTMKVPPQHKQEKKIEATEPAIDLFDVFGHEVEIDNPAQLTDVDALLLKGLEYAAHPVEGREKFKTDFATAASRDFAHNKIPVNDVSVWDYSRAVGAFFKAAAAKAWIEGALPTNAATVKWALASFGYPGLEFISSAVRITDALARQEWITERLDSLRYLIEFEYPLGSEIYRDENGAVYLIAEFEGVKKVFHDIARKVVQANDDLVPAVDVQVETPLKTKNNDDGPLELPIRRVIESLARPVPIAEDRVRANWNRGPATVLCPVCQLRPKADEGPPDSQYLCGVCFQRRRRLKRSSKWINGDEPDTIWIDEAMDRHGICALVTGHLGLGDWLTESIETSPFHFLTIGKGGKGQKQPVFLRVAASWEAARTFWEKVEGDDLPGMGPQRYHLTGTCDEELAPTYVYEAAIGRGTLSAVWNKDGFFVTASNIEYLLAQGEKGKSFQQLVEGEAIEFLLPQGYMIKEDAGRYHRRARDVKKIRFVVDKAIVQRAYRPVIPLLAQPRHFLAIVPAANAIQTCDKIRARYRDALGKVSTLLPLGLGIVFFDRRTPIYAVLQAGSKLLRMPLPRMNAQVENGVMRLAENRGALKVDAPNDEYFSRIAMADGTSRPIAQVAQGAVKTSVSLIDFVHLETTGQRYGLAYEGNGRRLNPERQTRALTMDDFRRIEELWADLNGGLKTSQINELFAAAEQKRNDWNLSYPVQDPTYSAFVAALVEQAEWQGQHAESNQEIARRIASGLLRDTVELHMKILKEKGRQD